MRGKKGVKGGLEAQVKMEFLSSRSVQNSNLTLETDEQKGEKRKSGEEVHFTPWERIFTYYARLPVPQRRTKG